MLRFIYNAHGIAVAGRITHPFDYIVEPRAACVLCSTGGSMKNTAPGFSLSDPHSGEFIFSYGSAETTVSGDKSGGNTHKTTVTSVVRNLNVLNVLRADEVNLNLNLTYDTGSDQVTIDTAGSRFVNLSLNGQQFDITLDHAFGREASNYRAFCQNHPECPERRGKVVYSLARHPSLHFENDEYGYHQQPNFGRIYFAEWTAAPNTQGLTMLRLRLGSPEEGDLAIGGGTGNGDPYP